MGNLICESCGINHKEILKTKISMLCRSCRLSEVKATIAKSIQHRNVTDPTRNTKIQLKRELTTLAKYGVTHISKLTETKHKVIATNIDRYGIPHTLELAKVKLPRITSLIENKQSINMKRKLAWTPEFISRVNTNRATACMVKYGVSHTSHIADIQHKIRQSAIERYSDPSFLLKCKLLLCNKYGVDNISKLHWVKNKVRDTNELSGRWLPLHLVSDFTRYRRLCTVETNRHKSKLFDTWDGTCFYEHKKLLTDSALCHDPMYRTIDHKISIFNGFISSTDPTIIGAYENLCICSLHINSKKGRQNIKDFINA